MDDLLNHHADTETCFARHLGPWLAEPQWFGEAVAAVQAGKTVPQAAAPKRGGEEPDYLITDDNIAIIPMFGAMTKGSSKFGGVNSLRTRRAVARAARDRDIDGIMLQIDSPGGMVAGTDELAEEVKAATKRKPVAAHIDDLGASAAYWVAAQADSVTVNRMGEVGSIGVYAVLRDSSEKFEREGLKVHLITTGDHKGAGAPGVPITDEQIAKFQLIVNRINEQFLSAVKTGRGMRIGDVRELATGETWVGADAESRGLVDGVMPFEQSYRALVGEVKGRRAGVAARHRAAENKIRIASARSGLHRKA